MKELVGNVSGRVSWCLCMLSRVLPPAEFVEFVSVGGWPIFGFGWAKTFKTKTMFDCDLSLLIENLRANTWIPHSDMIYVNALMQCQLHELRCKVLITVPLHALLDQFAVDFPGFCKVGMGHNQKINFDANGFIAVTPSVHLLQKLKFNTILVDEAHHPLPPKLPRRKQLFQFSATLEEEEGIDFQYTMSKAIEDGVLCDYDITVPAVTAHHAYVCLADLLIKQAGRFRWVLAYCNTVAEAKRFQMVLEELGLGAWHINAKTGWKERKRVMDEFTGILKKPVHVLVTVEVLGEGINIPNADTCMFVEPRNSYRSIIQAIGRVLRHHPAKPLGHIILPAVAVPEGGSHHVPVSPSSAESKEPTKNCKEQSLSQKAPVSGSVTELPNYPGGQKHKADISLLENLETGEAVRTRQNKAVRDESNDVNEKTVQGAETMGNGPVRGRELPYAPQEDPTSKHQRQDSVLSNKQGRTKHKQGTMRAGSLAGAAVRSQMLPESRAIGSISRANPLANSGGQTVGRSPEVVRVNTRKAKTNSGPQNHKTREGKELETHTTDENKMGTRITRHKRVRLQSLEGFGSSTQEYQSQLDRFLAKLMQADERLLGSSAGHRIQVVDCRLGVAGEVGTDAATNAVYGRLTALLMQMDPWQVRFERMEEFVRLYQRFPRKGSKDGFEASLSNWLTSQHRRLNLGRLPSQRLQRLQSTSIALIQKRVEKWLAGSSETIFKQRCQDIRKYMQKHNQLPSRSSPDPETRKLGYWLRNLRYSAPPSRVKEINALKAVHPLVKQFLQWDTNPVKIKKMVWSRKLEELSIFVCKHGRHPSQYRTAKSESRLSKWLSLQLSRIYAGNLPEKFVAALRDAHPLLSEAVAIAESNSLNMRSDKEQVKWCEAAGSNLNLSTQLEMKGRGRACPIRARCQVLFRCTAHLSVVSNSFQDESRTALRSFTLDFHVPAPVQFCTAVFFNSVQEMDGVEKLLYRFKYP